MNEVVNKINLINYINWLELFTEIETSFYDDSYLCRNGDIKELEHGNAQKLGYFYKELDKVLKQEDIKPIKDHYQTYYLITYHENNYEIGFMEGPDIIYFCRKVVSKEEIPVNFSTVEKRLEKNYN